MPALLLLLLLLLLLMTCACAVAANAPGPAVERPNRGWPGPLPRNVHVWEGVLPHADLAILASEARKLSEWANDGERLLQGKRATCWMDAKRRPASDDGDGDGGDGGDDDDNNNAGAGNDGAGKSLLIEEYVRLLARHVAQAHGDADWLGYEYWVQRVSPKETPAFHYDKDEALSSLRRRFVFPDVSSIFYLTCVRACVRGGAVRCSSIECTHIHTHAHTQYAAAPCPPKWVVPFVCNAPVPQGNK